MPRTKRNKKKQRHGRTGVPRRAPIVEVPTEADPNSPAYKVGFEKGHTEGFVLAKKSEREFLTDLHAKRNMKDVRGLIERRLGGTP